MRITNPSSLFSNQNQIGLIFVLVLPCILFIPSLIFQQHTPFILVAPIALLIISVVYPDVAIGILLIIAPLRTLIATEAPSFPISDVGQLYLVMVAVSVGLWVVRNKPYHKSWHHPILVATVLYLSAIMLSSVFSQSMTAWFQEMLKWIELLAIAFWVYLIFDAANWTWLVNGLLLAGLCNGVIGIYEFFGGSGADHLVVNGSYFRAFGTFGQPNPFGAFMGILSPIALGLSLSAFPLIQRTWQTKTLCLRKWLTLLFYISSFIILSLALIMSWSRGAWLGFIASSAVVVVLYPRRLIHRILLIGLGLSSSLAVLMLGLVPSSISQRLGTVFNEAISLQDVRGVQITTENYAVVERLAHWQAAIRMVEYSPYLGTGLGNYEVVYPSFQLINWHEPLGHAHNYYLNLLGETGLVGFSGYVMWWVVIFWQTLQAIRHPDTLKRSLALGLLGTWVYILIHSLTDNLYVNNLFLHVGVLLGVLMILTKQVNHFYKLKLNVE